MVIKLIRWALLSMGILLVLAALFFLISGLFFYSKWNEEHYLLEGESYRPFIMGTRNYYVAGEKVVVGGSAHNHVSFRNLGYAFYITKSFGPFRLNIRFEEEPKLNEKKIIIHDVKIESSLNKIYKITDSLPIIVKPEPIYESEYANSEEKDKHIIYYYRHSFSGLLDFDFRKREIIFVTLDVEVVKKGVSKRETITLKLIPFLDKNVSLQIDYGA